SNSGKNPVPIEVAEYAKKMGVKTVGITSLSFSEKEVSRHSSGKYLKDFVDLTIDNHIPVGDALLGYQNREMNFAPGSTLVGVAILQSIFAESIKIMYDNNFNPPILKSANIEGADQHNEKLFKKYSNRI